MQVQIILLHLYLHIVSKAYGNTIGHQQGQYNVMLSVLAMVILAIKSKTPVMIYNKWKNRICSDQQIMCAMTMLLHGRSINFSRDS